MNPRPVPTSLSLLFPLALASASAQVPVADPISLLLEEKLVSSDAAEGDDFAASLAISGDTLVVSARENDEAGEGAGAAYVFERDPGTGAWIEVAKLLASNATEHDYFGEAASIGGDVVIIGSDRDEETGAAYVFERDAGGSGAWGEVARLVPDDVVPGTHFGWEVDVSDDGSRLIVGQQGKVIAPGVKGAAYIYEKVDGAWTQVAKLDPASSGPGDEFGFSVRLDGERAIVGAEADDDLGTDSGSAYIFEREASGTWIEIAHLKAEDGSSFDYFGRAVALYGDIAMVGASEDSDLFNKAGSAYLFERSEVGVWTQTAKLADAGQGAFFGRCVALQENLAIVGAPGDDQVAITAGAVFFYGRDDAEPSGWTLLTKLVGEDSVIKSRFGYALSIDADRLLIGADVDDTPAGDDTGSAYVYRWSRGLGLSTEGSCPGAMTLVASGATPLGNVTFLLGPPGPSMIPGGPCAGTEIGVVTQRRALTAADPGGTAELQRALGANNCALSIQALDMETCAVSAVVPVP